MDQDHRRGTGTQAEGSVKEAIGKVTGNAVTKAGGTAQMSAGQVQRAVGSASDKARTAIKGDE